MKYLTTANAAQYLGKTLTSEKKIRHYYPITVGQWEGGTYYYRDRIGVCMPVPTPEDKFNSVSFDTVIEERSSK